MATSRPPAARIRRVCVVDHRGGHTARPDGGRPGAAERARTRTLRLPVAAVDGFSGDARRQGLWSLDRLIVRSTCPRYLEDAALLRRTI